MGIEKSPGRKSAGKAQRDERAETAQEKQLKKMTEEAIPPLVVKLAAPTVISMVMTSIYIQVTTTRHYRFSLWAEKESFQLSQIFVHNYHMISVQSTLLEILQEAVNYF